MAGRVSGAAEWIAARTAAAPPVLRARALSYVETGGEPAEQLAAAGARALATVLAQSGDRASALDLLAADGLITLALLAKAEAHPAGLDAFAAELLAK